MKKKSAIKKPNWLIYFLYKTASKLVSKFRHNLKITKNELKGVKGSYVVIANHESAIDFLSMAAATKKRTHFVISNSFYQSLPIQPLLKWCGVIPKQQFQTSIVDMKAMKYVLENNTPLVIYPAGLMSENGITTPIPLGTGKTLKWLGKDVYIAYTRGSYLTNPKWSTKARKGKITLEITKLYSAEQLKELTAEYVQNEITIKLFFDAYKNNEIDKFVYKNGDNIEGLEHVLYWCPKCNNEFTLQNISYNTIKCSCCGNTIVADKMGFLNKVNEDDVIYKHPSDWSLKIIEELKNHIINNPDYQLSDECNIHIIDNKKHKFVEGGNGNITLNRAGFALNATINNEEINVSLPMSYFPILPFKPNKYFELQEGNNIYRIYLKDSKMVTKWMNSVKILFELAITK